MRSPDETGAFTQALHLGNHREAGEWLAQNLAGDVFGLCFAIVQNPAVAEDLAQEVFAKAFTGLDGFRGDASPRTWLLAITRNRCIDHLRKQKRWSAFIDGDDPEEVAEEVSLPNNILSRRAELEDALLSLSENERALIVLRFRQGLSYEELATAFGLKPGTARMRISRALGKMRDLLEAEITEPVLQRIERFAGAEPLRSRLEKPISPQSLPPSPKAPPPAQAASPRGGAAVKPQPPLHAYFQSVHPPPSAALLQRLSALTDGLK